MEDNRHMPVIFLWRKIVMENSMAVFNEIEFKEEIRKFLVIKSQEACKYARDTLHEKAQNIIGYFYKHYTPLYYHRTNETYDYSVQPFYDQFGSLVVGGVFIDGTTLGNNVMVSKLVNSRHAANKLNSVWNYGMHGGLAINAGIVMIPTPHDILKNYWTRKRKDECFDYGEKIARKANYKFLSF